MRTTQLMELKLAHINPESKEFTRCTIAVKIPEKEQLIHMFNAQQSAFYLPLGVSFVHPKDQFVRRIGKVRASEKALFEPSKFCNLLKIEPREDRWVYHLTALVPDGRPSKNKFGVVEFGVSICPKSENSRLGYAIWRE